VCGLTYKEVGATAGALPVGYDHVRRAVLLGYGAEVFARASEALMTWEMHRRAGLTVDAGGQQVVLGGEVRLGWSAGPFRLGLPCRVVRVVDSAEACGFAYGTLRGHPEQGEESFVVHLGSAGTVTFEIVAFSRPGRWWSRLGAPIARLIQRGVTTRYLDALRTGCRTE
jgi:uncharacterized protein (UPF0548 family)